MKAKTWPNKTWLRDLVPDSSHLYYSCPISVMNNYHMNTVIPYNYDWNYLFRYVTFKCCIGLTVTCETKRNEADWKSVILKNSEIFEMEICNFLYEESVICEMKV